MAGLALKVDFPRHRRRGVNKQRLVALEGGKDKPSRIIPFVYVASGVAAFGHSSWCLATLFKWKGMKRGIDCRQKRLSMGVGMVVFVG